MGSVLYFENVENWELLEEVSEKEYSICIGEIDDYKTEPLNVTMPKVIYDRLILEEYVGAPMNRDFMVYNQQKELVYSVLLRRFYKPKSELEYDKPPENNEFLKSMAALGLCIGELYTIAIFILLLLVAFKH